MNALIIDIGTSSMRGTLFTQDGERLVSQQVKYQPDKYPDGRIEQDPSDWTESIEKIILGIVKEAAKSNLSIDCVAITSQRSAIIPIDRDGNPLMNTIMWQDQRNAGLCHDLEDKNQLIFEKSGAQINTVFSGSRMMWIRRNCPEVCKKLYKFVNIPEYVIHFMTGNYVTDVTYGSRSHLMNLRERRWDTQMLDLFEVQQEELCTLQEPGTVVGTVTKQFSAKTGLKEGTPVITSGGDQQCAAIGQGAYKEGTLSIVLGTGAFLVTAVENVPEDLSPRLICNCSGVSGKYMLEANVLTCCSAFDWFCQNFYDWGDGTNQENEIDYSRINQDLEKLDGSVSEVLVLPYFQGRSTPEWNPNARASFENITLGTSRNSILKGLLEGIFLEIKNNFSQFEINTNIQKAYISGGMTNSSLINQMQSDIYGIPLYRMDDRESTALGALMVALTGQGVYDSIESAFENIRGPMNQECYNPRMKYSEAYSEKLNEMNDIYHRIYR